MTEKLIEKIQEYTKKGYEVKSRSDSSALLIRTKDYSSILGNFSFTNVVKLVERNGKIEVSNK